MKLAKEHPVLESTRVRDGDFDVILGESVGKRGTDVSPNRWWRIS